jgi:hypothetical protein
MATVPHPADFAYDVGRFGPVWAHPMHSIPNKRALMLAIGTATVI